MSKLLEIICYCCQIFTLYFHKTIFVIKRCFCLALNLSFCCDAHKEVGTYQQDTNYLCIPTTPVACSNSRHQSYYSSSGYAFSQYFDFFEAICSRSKYLQQQCGKIYIIFIIAESWLNLQKFLSLLRSVFKTQNKLWVNVPNRTATIFESLESFICCIQLFNVQQSELMLTKL